MTSMKRRTAIAVTLGVWIAALGSAGALTYDLERARPVERLTLPLAPPVRAAPAVVVLESSIAEPQVLYVRTITVVGRVPRRSVVAVTPEPTSEATQTTIPERTRLHDAPR